MPTPVSARRAPEIIGHRGAPRAYAENTLPAFREAISLGADAVELDVHLTRDGAVVVHHDPIPRARAADGTRSGRRFSELTLAEVQSFRLEGGLVIPSLPEVLAEIDGRVDVYVEVKGHGAERAVADLLGPRATWTAVHAFDHRVVPRVRALVPALRGGVLLDSYLIDTCSAMRAAGASDLWQRWEFIDESLVGDVHEAGGRVIAWTVDDLQAAEYLARIGVDGICTDVPGAIREALSRSA
jgi:glycerophosphoryl diester phosphodiesterase